jgi:hypothetical protein
MGRLELLLQPNRLLDGEILGADGGLRKEIAEKGKDGLILVQD